MGVIIQCEATWKKVFKKKVFKTLVVHQKRLSQSLFNNVVEDMNHHLHHNFTACLKIVHNTLSGMPGCHRQGQE